MPKRDGHIKAANELKNLGKRLKEAQQHVTVSDTALVKLLVDAAASAERSAHAITDLETIVRLHRPLFKKLQERVDQHDKLLKSYKQS